MNFIDNVKELVKSKEKKTIILTEGNDIRVVEAIEKVIDYCNIIVIGDIIKSIPGVKVINPMEYIDSFSKELYELRKDKGLTLEDAKELVKLLKGMLAHVNLIPINKIESGKYIKSSNENIIKFRDYLNDNGIVATIRRELGSDIEAACGQLRRKNLR